MFSRKNTPIKNSGTPTLDFFTTFSLTVNIFDKNIVLFSLCIEKIQCQSNIDEKITKLQPEFNVLLSES